MTMNRRLPTEIRRFPPNIPIAWTVSVAYLRSRCRRPTQPQASTGVRYPQVKVEFNPIWVNEANSAERFLVGTGIGNEGDS